MSETVVSASEDVVFLKMGQEILADNILKQFASN